MKLATLNAAPAIPAIPAIDTTAPVKPNSEDFIPKSYIAIHRSQTCACCGHSAEWTELFAEADGPTAWRLAKRPRLLRRETQIRWDVPLYQSRGRPETLPFCNWCHQPQVDQNRNFPVPIHHEPQRVVAIFSVPTAPTPESAPAKPSAPTTNRGRPPKPVASLDDLCNMF